MMRTARQKTGVLFEVLDDQGNVKWQKFQPFGRRRKGETNDPRMTAAAREQEDVALRIAGEEKHAGNDSK